MTLKQRAMFDVFVMLATCAAAGAAAYFSSELFGPLITGGLIALVFVAYFVKTAYDVRVRQLTYEADRVERALKEGR